MLDNKYKIIKKYEHNDSILGICSYDNTEYFLKCYLGNDNTRIKMFKNEVNIFYLLRNETFIPKIYEFKFEENNNYIIFEYIKGKTLIKYDFKDIKEKLNIMIKILDCLNLIHKYNIIHCDLKLSNILIDEFNNIKIIDYAIAKKDNDYEFQRIGTLEYASLEYIEQKVINNQTDIYSLGIIFYYLITGAFPFDGSKEEKINCKRNNIYKKIEDIKLNYIFEKCINKDLNIRYKNTLELKNDILKLNY